MESVRGCCATRVCGAGVASLGVFCPGFRAGRPPRLSGAMWRRCLRLQDSGRRLRDQAMGGLTARMGPGPGPTTQPLARAYAPLTERKRFYQNVSITQGEGGFEINLDHRKLKTPQAKLFTVPSEALAIAVATEWDSQQDTIKFYTMHLTTLCNTSLDNPMQRNREQLIRAAVKFLDTDTIWVEEPETLVELQKNEWDPVIEWAEKRYDVQIGSSTSIMGPSIPAKTREVLASHLASYNMWALQGPDLACVPAGIEFVATQLKSMVLTLGLIDLHLTVEQAVLLSRLEEEYQIQKWGNIEWAHDYELHELRARTAAGTLFIHLCSESTTVKHKLLQE
ncbi:ATP synthase mitochondrial F1 complex assembly factor 2 isoform X2 [Erinaceus europaeus]|uniref:ATP synthase mitochondrial F1 complex assembly factor 2 n=1 Tax=Erinaceus europaeus TaxID=9365 RepID=A0A1S3WFD3_ERIEU|nr:ATP synthase mitochondrial F1 complex assembly factor 2 isoform X2 [Erinaceus europaeus]